MATNIEIKARVEDLEKLKARVEKLSDTPVTVIPQEDTFFHTARGRLKLRFLAPDDGQLVYYRRRDVSGPKRSDYLISSTADPESLKEVLASSLGIRGLVRKKRLLYMVGNTRIHLDEVEGLGSFLELEVVLCPGQSEEEGQEIAAQLMAKLGIQDADLVDVAYIDLIEDTTP